MPHDAWRQGWSCTRPTRERLGDRSRVDIDSPPPAPAACCHAVSQIRPAPILCGKLYRTRTGRLVSKFAATLATVRSAHVARLAAWQHAVSFVAPSTSATASPSPLVTTSGHTPFPRGDSFSHDARANTHRSHSRGESSPSSLPSSPSCPQAQRTPWQRLHRVGKPGGKVSTLSGPRSARLTRWDRRRIPLPSCSTHSSCPLLRRLHHLPVPTVIHLAPGNSRAPPSHARGRSERAVPVRKIPPRGQLADQDSLRQRTDRAEATRGPVGQRRHPGSSEAAVGHRRYRSEGASSFDGTNPMARVPGLSEKSYFSMSAYGVRLPTEFVVPHRRSVVSKL